jgi:hypothetical protein
VYEINANEFCIIIKLKINGWPSASRRTLYDIAIKLEKRMIKREINKNDIEEKPYLLWNAFIDIVSMESYDELSDIQKTAQLCFWYDSELQNGGHLQYFLNQGKDNAEKAIIACEKIGAYKQTETLKKAIEVYKKI